MNRWVRRLSLNTIPLRGRGEWEIRERKRDKDLSRLTDTCTNTHDAGAMMKNTKPQSWIKVFFILMACLHHYSRKKRWLPITGSESHTNLAVGGQALPHDGTGCRRRGGKTEKWEWKRRGIILKNCTTLALDVTYCANILYRLTYTMTARGQVNFRLLWI